VSKSNILDPTKSDCVTLIVIIIEGYWNQYIIEVFMKDGSGAINTSELLGLMRAMGENPTEDDVLNLMMEADLDGNGTIEFLELMKQKYRILDSKEDLRLAHGV
jgi:Ca2+-binding EF-hand superfamily protein